MTTPGSEGVCEEYAPAPVQDRIVVPLVVKEVVQSDEEFGRTRMPLQPRQPAYLPVP